MALQDTGNKISRRAHIDGKQNIMLGGRTVIMAGVHMRGDLCRLSGPAAEGEKPKPPPTAISIGKASVMSTNVILHPPMRIHHGQMTYYPIRIGDNVFVGQGTYISSATIHSHVHIGANCVLGPFTLIKESSKIMANTVVPANMVIPAMIIGDDTQSQLLKSLNIEGVSWVSRTHRRWRLVRNGYSGL